MVVVVLAWGATVGLYALLNLIFETGESACLFKNAAAGVPCPTCGSTRIVLFTATGRVLAAMLQNPLVFVGLAACAIWLIALYGFKRRIELIATRRAKRVLVAALLVLCAVNWAYVIAIDGPWDNGVKSQVADAQSRDRGIYRFFSK